MSLAKYLWIIDRRCDERLDVHDVVAFLQAVLERVDWSRDIHFQTATTVDTLDYSGSGFNQGSKAIVAAVGAPRRRLPTEVPADFWLPDGFGSAKVSLPGVLVVAGPKFTSDQSGRAAMSALCDAVDVDHPINAFPLAVVVDDSDFASRNVDNFVWVTFTRSNPATDVHGIGAAVVDKHWGCRGSLIIDARLKPHHAPPLEVDPETARSVDALAERGGPLARWL
jgi:4-hydroxy-3-polyprenylbenzoate decarboxylase